MWVWVHVRSGQVSAGGGTLGGREGGRMGGPTLAVREASEMAYSWNVLLSAEKSLWNSLQHTKTNRQRSR